jgi:hypothetical protein
MAQLSATTWKRYRYFVSQSSEFCRHNPLCCFSMSNTKGKRIFLYRLSPETFGYSLISWRKLTTCRLLVYVSQHLLLPLCFVSNMTPFWPLSLKRRVEFQLKFHHTTSYYHSFEVHFNIIFPSSLRLSSGLVSSYFQTEVLYIFIIFPVGVLCSTHHTILDLITQIFGEEYTLRISSLLEYRGTTAMTFGFSFM